MKENTSFILLVIIFLIGNNFSLFLIFTQIIYKKKTYDMLLSLKTLNAQKTDMKLLRDHDLNTKELMSY